MKRLKLVPLAHLMLLVLLFSGEALADRDAEIRDLKLEKEKLNSEIQKLNRQIASTDSMLKADDSRYKTLSQRYKADTERRRAEIDSLNSKIKAVAGELQTERNKQARAKNRSDNVAAKRKALRAELAGISKKLEAQVAETLPWERESRLDRVKSLTRDIESGNASEEEGFSRLKSLIAEETKFGDEVAIINSPLTRKNGELINASILRIGNQWMVYSDENGTVFGTLVRKVENGKVNYEWNEDLNLEERAAVRLAIEVKQAKKPPQIVNLPVSLSVVGGGR
jgi:multidrug efflux pump subunit AcrA (membrane-fusion protein)